MAVWNMSSVSIGDLLTCIYTHAISIWSDFFLPKIYTAVHTAVYYDLSTWKHANAVELSFKRIN